MLNGLIKAPPPAYKYPTLTFSPHLNVFMLLESPDFSYTPSDVGSRQICWSETFDLRGTRLAAAPVRSVRLNRIVELRLNLSEVMSVGVGGYQWVTPGCWVIDACITLLS